MSTKIGSLDSTPVPVSTGRAVKHAGSNGSPAASAAPDSTSDTHITDSARKLAVLEQVVQDLPAIDQARVQKVSSELTKGSYQVNAERVADKLLRAEQELADFN